MIARVARSLACAALFVGLAPACIDETIPVAEAPDRDAGDAGDHGPKGCTKSSDCHPDSYCELAKCGDERGVCQRYPTTLTYDENVVCGCNNITYFNDSLRRLDGQSLQLHESCPDEVATKCGGFEHIPCPGAVQTCARLALGNGTACPAPDDYGNCWLLPDQCPTMGPPNEYRPKWTRCGGGPCVDTCTAIKESATKGSAPYRFTLRCL